LGAFTSASGPIGCQDHPQLVARVQARQPARIYVVERHHQRWSYRAARYAAQPLARVVSCQIPVQRGGTVWQAVENAGAGAEDAAAAAVALLLGTAAMAASAASATPVPDIGRSHANSHYRLVLPIIGAQT
jgi:hypothetical protein